MSVGVRMMRTRERQCATDLVALAPNILFASGTLSVTAQIKAFARSPNGGIILSPNAASLPAGHKLIITLAAQLKLPAVYPTRYMVGEGGLMSYSNDSIAGSRRAADYVDRILKGEKPADLPVQQETKIELSSTSRPQRRWASTCRNL